jgi:hypothetical protein
MKASRAALLAASLTLALAAHGVAQGGCGGDGGQWNEGGGAPRHHHHSDDSEPRTWMSPEGTTHDSNGRPYYHSDPDRDRYLREMRRYNALPWYKRMWESPPTYPHQQDLAGIRG